MVRPNVVYEGRGREEFEDPSGSVEGPVVISFNEYGESSVQMTVNLCHPDPPLTDVTTVLDNLERAFALVQAARSEVTTKTVNQDNTEASWTRLCRNSPVVVVQ